LGRISAGSREPIVNVLTKRGDDGPKKGTNVSLSEALVSDARALGIDVSRACEEGLESEIRRERIRRWQQENEAAFDAWNKFVDRNGVPLAEYRKF